MRAPAFRWKLKRTWIRSARWPFRPFISCHARAHDRTQKQEKSCKCMNVAMCAQCARPLTHSASYSNWTVRLGLHLRCVAALPVFPPPPGRRKKHWIYILIRTRACLSLLSMEELARARVYSSGSGLLFQISTLSCCPHAALAARALSDLLDKRKYKRLELKICYFNETK